MKYKIVFEIETDRPLTPEVKEQLRFDMEVQLESLSDGTYPEKWEYTPLDESSITEIK
jgi:hypothetical protein